MIKDFFKRSLFLAILLVCWLFSNAEKKWTAQWITSPQVKNEANTWICFRKDIELPKIKGPVIASISVDSKYWLWINGEMVVFEGGLKRGPSPEDTYYDEVDITSYLKKGHNTIAVLLWYFGKEGFSHKSSGQAGMLFDCNSEEINLNSDKTWQTLLHPSFLPFEGVQPNVRLPESSLCYDARKDPGEWTSEGFDDSSWQGAKELGTPPCAPWNKLVLRPIPQWKDFGLKDYENNNEIPSQSTEEPIVCKLPANLQVTPYLKVETKAGQVIDIRTDHFMGGSEPNVQARYITKDGVQEYENLGWMNGEEVIYSLPKGIKILELKYRETGYDTELVGHFHCSDDFFNRLWEKARRTLYVTMRDTYMDCPDRERSQWWGDEVNEGGETFYTFDCASHLLQKKGMYELINWQKPDGVIFSPVPAGNWDKELPCQMLASVGYFGFWNYYLNTGDLQTISDLYDGVKRYLNVWSILPNGTLAMREGGWTWGDHGMHKDMELMQNTWYYLALKGIRNMALVLGKENDAHDLQLRMDKFKPAFNQFFWTGNGYRHPEYNGETDDRGQALAVVAGLADDEKYPALYKIFTTTEYSSPYMEKYVIEALFMMGEDEYALHRLKKRFGPMVNDPDCSTLWEVWGNSNDGFTGGSTNHAWSGGGLTLLSQYVCGIAPIEPGYKKFLVAPRPVNLTSASTSQESVNGRIEVAFEKRSSEFELNLLVPENTSALVKLPFGSFFEVMLNGKLIWENGQAVKKRIVRHLQFDDENQVTVFPGEWKFKGKK